MATYGHSFTLASAREHGLSAPSKGGGKGGVFTREAGLYAFYEVSRGHVAVFVARTVGEPRLTITTTRQA